MVNKMIQGGVLFVLIVGLPVLGNTAMFYAPHVWVLLVFGVLASVFQPAYNPWCIGAKPRDRGTGAQIIWSVYFTQCAMVLESAYFRYPESVRWDGLAIVGLVAMGVGLAVRTWAVFTLGPLFTMHIAVQNQHSVVRKGPYRFVRHPSYLGAFILYVATTVFFHAWFSMVVTILILALAFLRRIHFEEEMLVVELGAEYEAYRSEVRRFLPGIW